MTRKHNGHPQSIDPQQDPSVARHGEFDPPATRIAESAKDHAAEVMKILTTETALSALRARRAERLYHVRQAQAKFDY